MEIKGRTLVIGSEDVEITEQDLLNQQKQQRKNEIYNLLDKIDLKSIRAIRENDTVRIQQYENEAIELREELGVLNE